MLSSFWNRLLTDLLQRRALPHHMTFLTAVKALDLGQVFRLLLLLLSLRFITVKSILTVYHTNIYQSGVITYRNRLVSLFKLVRGPFFPEVLLVIVVIVLIISFNSYLNQFLKVIQLIFLVEVSSNVLLQAALEQYYQGFLVKFNLYYF